MMKAMGFLLRLKRWLPGRRFLKWLGILLLASVVLIYLLFWFGPTVPLNRVKWGVNFSPKHTGYLGLDWQKTYLALLDDLGAKRVKLAVHWDQLAPTQETFDFSQTDWLIKEAETRGARLVPVVGMKTPRWPECHIPDWAKSFDKGSQQHYILKYLEAFVTRYKDSPAIEMWQVENEPLFSFGECPWLDTEFLKLEIAKVKSIDPDRPVMVTDTGEFSFWFTAAQLGDVVGSTLYRKVWSPQFEMYATYPFSPNYYKRRAQLVQALYGKEVINAELQAEPWGPTLYYELPLEEQMKTMPFEQLLDNVDFARRTRFREAYFWGAEWWYWMKEKNGDARYWDAARDIFRSG